MVLRLNLIRKQFVSIVGAAEHPVYGQIERERKIKRSTHAHVSTCSVSPVEPRLQVPPRGHSCWNSSPMIFSRPSCKFSGRGRSAVYQLHSKSIQPPLPLFFFIHLLLCFLLKNFPYKFVETCFCRRNNILCFLLLLRNSSHFCFQIVYLLFHFFSTHICSVSSFSKTFLCIYCDIFYSRLSLQIYLYFFFSSNDRKDSSFFFSFSFLYLLLSSFLDFLFTLNRTKDFFFLFHLLHVFLFKIFLIPYYNLFSSL